MFCTNCGNELEEGSNFCSFCGNKLAGAAEIRTVGAAQVEVYRVSRWAGKLCSLRIFIDNMEVGRVEDGNKQLFSLQSGYHEIFVQLNWSPTIQSDTFRFNIGSGQILRLKCDYTFGAFAMLTGWYVIQSLFSKVIKIEPY